MDLSGNCFVYDGVNSVKYGLRFMEINTERFMQIAGTLTHQTTFLQAAKRRVINGVVYTDSSPEFECEIISEQPISIFNRREIEDWLFYHNSFKKLYVSPTSKDEGEVVDLPFEKVGGGDENFSAYRVYPYIRCIFTNPVAIEFTSGLHGWQCTCVCDSPFATLDEAKVNVNIENIEDEYATGLKSFDICVDSDMKDYIYPLVYFKIISDDENTRPNDFSIRWMNKTDDINREFRADGFTASSDVYCNSETKRFVNSMISSNPVNYYYKIEKRNFPRLMPGSNKIIVGTDIAEVTITWANKRWFM